MNRISRYFTREEVACKCGCGEHVIDVEVMMVADRVREFYGRPIVPSSAVRCKHHNKALGGSENRWHTKSKAIDLPVDNPILIYDYLDLLYPDKYGIGLYKSFLHIDTRPTKARWGVIS